MVNMKNLHPKKVKIDEKSYNNIRIYFIDYVNIKNLTYAKINGINPLYFIIDKANGYIEENNGNKYLALVPTNENKDKLTKYEELWNKIRDLIISVTNNTGDYNEKNMKIKFNSNNNLPLKKKVVTLLMLIRQVHQGNVLFATIGIFQIKQLSFNRISAMNVIMY